VGFDEDMFALLKSKDWEACHKRIEEEPALLREGRVSIGLWRAAILEWRHRYGDALQTLDTIRTEAFTRCGFLWARAEILCKMGKFVDAIETVRNAPFGVEIDTFPALTYEAIFLYCYLLKRSGGEPQPNLVAALPEDFVTRTWDGKKVEKPTFRRRRAARRPGLETFCAQPERRVERSEDFFIWILCNPLKSPESAKGMQGNPRTFPFFSLDFLARRSP
jgi:hypothetical protein